MGRSSFRASLVAALVFASATMGAMSATGNARGDDSCPEPNGTFQAACVLVPESDELGFISQPDDTDAYAFAALDFNTHVKVELAERPAPYRLELADWGGQLIASSGSGSVEAVVPLPGVYYAFVDSPGGQFSDGEPYRVGARLTYPTSRVPRRLRPAGVLNMQGWDDPKARVETVGGRQLWTGKEAGSTSEPRETGLGWTGLTVRGTSNPVPINNFTCIFDARLLSGSDGGFWFQFRRPGLGAVQYSNDGYRVLVNAAKGAVKVTKTIKHEVSDVTLWQPSPASNTSGGVNRTVIQMIGNDLRVNVNGVEVVRVIDDTFQEGDAGHGIITWADPVTVAFDNLVCTGPE